MPRNRAYFDWLVRTFCTDPLEDERMFEHIRLLEQMFKKEFYYTLRNDENRADDGLYLRYLYSLNEDGTTPDKPCTFLEFLIGIGMRLSESLADGEELPVFLYFWELAANIGLTEFTDESYRNNSTTFIVDDIMNNMMDRKYDRDGGCGGLFPLRNPRRNQRRTEIWYQMQEYIFENPTFFKEDLPLKRTRRHVRSRRD